MHLVSRRRCSKKRSTSFYGVSGDVRFARIREEEYLFLLAVLCPPSVFPTIFLWFARNEKLWRMVEPWMNLWPCY